MNECDANAIDLAKSVWLGVAPLVGVWVGSFLATRREAAGYVRTSRSAHSARLLVVASSLAKSLGAGSEISNLADRSIELGTCCELASAFASSETTAGINGFREAVEKVIPLRAYATGNATLQNRNVHGEYGAALEELATQFESLRALLLVEIRRH